MRQVHKLVFGLVGTLLALLCLTVAPTRCDPPLVQVQPAPKMPAFETWETPRLLYYGHDLLKKGKNYSFAIAALTIATQREPQNCDAQLDLAYACTGRFASLAEAGLMQKNYPFEKKLSDAQQIGWQKAQADPTHPLSNAPPLPPIEEPYTPDDGITSMLSTTDAHAQMKKLGLQAVAALDAVKQAEASLPSAQKAESANTRGWVLALLSRYGKDVVTEVEAAPDLKNTTHLHDTLIVTHKDITDCFRQAAEAMPKKAIYWQSLAWSYVPELLALDTDGGFHKYLANSPICTPENVELAQTAMAKAVAIRPSFFDYQYQMALILFQAKPLDSLIYLKKAASLQGSNALLWYLVAEQILQQDPPPSSKNGSPLPKTSSQTTEAVGAIQKGNQALDYAAIPITSPLPTLLKSPWQYHPVYGLAEDNFVVSIAAQQAYFSLKTQSGQGDQSLTMPGAEAVFHMGIKIASHFQAYDIGWADPGERGRHSERVMMGDICYEMARGILNEAQKKYPDDAKADCLTSLKQEAKYLDSLEKVVLGL